MTKIRRPLITSAESQQVAIADLAKAYDLLSMHVHIADPNGNIIYINLAAIIRTGYSLEKCIGHNPGDLWGGNESEEFYMEMWDTIKNRNLPFSGQLTNKSKAGIFYRQHILITPVLDQLKDPIYFVSVQTDLD